MEFSEEYKKELKRSKEKVAPPKKRYLIHI